MYKKEFEFQRGRQKSLSRTTDKTKANKIKRKTNINTDTILETRTLQKPE